jgi:hypothetical protein
MIIQTNAPDRKVLVKALVEITKSDAKYNGPPSFSYTVGDFTINRNGTVSFEGPADSDDADRLINELARRGFVDGGDGDVEELVINVPTEGMNGAMLRNLVFMIKSKQYLLNKVSARENFTVSDKLIAALTETEPNSAEEFFALCSRHEIRGLAFRDGYAAFSFPISESPAKNRAYAELAAFMVARVKEASRVLPTEQKPENEKYYLRTWLLRLGFTGDGAKESRKSLLAGLRGHTAFRTPADAERHKARLASRKIDFDCFSDLPEDEDRN